MKLRAWLSVLSVRSLLPSVRCSEDRGWTYIKWCFSHLSLRLLLSARLAMALLSAKLWLSMPMLCAHRCWKRRWTSFSFGNLSWISTYHVCWSYQVVRQVRMASLCWGGPNFSQMPEVLLSQWLPTVTRLLLNQIDDRLWCTRSQLALKWINLIVMRIVDRLGVGVGEHPEIVTVSTAFVTSITAGFGSSTKFTLLAQLRKVVDAMG